MKERYSTSRIWISDLEIPAITDSLQSPAVPTELSVVGKLICNKQSLFSNYVICK